MNQIKFNNELISITYNSNEEAEHAKWIFYNHELDKVEVEDNILTFHYKGLRFLDSIIRDIIAKTFNNIRTETFSIDKGTYISEHYEAVVGTNQNDNRLFKISVINQRGTKGVFGFGIWQFGRILTFNGDCLTLRNSNLDDTRHKLSFEDGLTVCIEIVEIQSQ